MLDEMGISTGIDTDFMLCLGRIFEWTMERTLPCYTTKAGPPIHYPVEWNIKTNDLRHVPPYGPPQIFWADPSKYVPASNELIEKEFEGRPLRWGKCSSPEEPWCVED